MPRDKMLQTAPFAYAYHRIILDGAGNPVDYEFLDVNPGFEAQTGLKAEEILGKKLSEVMPDAFKDQFDWVNAYGQVALTGNPQEFRQYADSLGKWFRIQAFRPEPLCFAVVFTDITAETMEAEGRIRLENIIAGTRAGTWEWNVQTGETRFNQRWAEIVGYTLEELQPISIRTWGSLAHPDDLAKSGELLEKHFRGELPYYEFESRMKHKNGSWVWVLDRGKVTSWTPDGKPLWMQGTHQDISPWKEMETRLRDTAHQALLASKAKSEFLANMSHEIRTPLNGVIGFLDMLSHTPLSEKQRDYMDNAQISAQSLLGVINDILDFSKIEAGRLDLSPLHFTLGDLLEDCRTILSISAEKKGVEFRMETSPDLPSQVKTDPLRLRQILLNLLNNAVKFTPSGTITFRVTTAGTSGGKIGIRFEVEDTGIGIPEEQQARLFQAFSQGDASTTRRFGGTGLGLVISSTLVKYLGGELRMESREGRGSRFYFTLHLESTAIPVSTENPDRCSSSEHPAGIKCHSTVLSVEDIPLNAKLIQAFLKRMDPEMTVLQAANGAQALEILKTQTPDLILMDVQMPVMDGLEATRRIREAEASTGAHLPIIALTAGALAEERDRCLESGMDAFLTKPVNAQELQQLLESFHIL